MKKILILPHSLRFNFFKELKTLLDVKNEVHFYNGEHTNKDHFILNEKSLVTLPHPKNLLECNNKKNLDIENIILKAEKKLNISLNRILLSNEREIGHSYLDDSYYILTNSFFKKLNRYNVNKIILNACNKVIFFLKKEKYDLILSGNNSSFYYFLISFFSKYFDIPYYVSRRSKIIKDSFFWTKDHFMQNVEAIKIFKKKKLIISKSASNYLVNYRKNPETIKYIQENWRKKENFLLNKFLNFSNIIFNNFASLLNKKYKYKEIINPFFESFHMLIYKNKRSHYKKINENDLKKTKYLYYSLHKEPELALNFISPKFHNQLNVVKLLSANTPFNYKLFIREHRLNDGRRKRKFFNVIKKFPNVVLIDPFDSQFKYIKNADLVITDNGSSGWEALMMKKKVLGIGESFYYAILKNKTNDFDEIDKKILKSLSNKEMTKDNELALLYDAEKSTTFFEDKKGISKSLSYIKF